MDIALAVGIPLVIVFGIAIYAAHKSDDGVPPPRPGQPSPGSPPDTVTTAQAPSPSVSLIPIDAFQPTPQASGKHTPYTNFGTIVFALFAALSLLICLARGIVPIYLVEAGLWAGLAWYWHKKNFVSPSVNLAVLLVAVFVAAGEGFVVGRQFSGNSYTYVDRDVERGKVHYRVSASGRTDVFGSTGWKPVSFDTPPEDVPADALQRIVLSGAHAEYLADRVCFDVQNDTEFILRDITLNISLSQVPQNTFSEFGTVTLTPGILEKGERQASLCGNITFPNPSPSGWTYTMLSAKGWKQ